MELVRTASRIDFNDPFNPWVEMRSILRETTGQEKLEIQGSPLITDNEERKQRVEFHIKTLILHQEGVSSQKESIDFTVKKTEALNRITNIPKISTMTFESHFIDPYPLPFHEILQLTKKRFLQQSGISELSTDVGLIFEQTEGKTAKHLQFGPMSKEQLNNVFLIWKRKELPDNFIFVATKYIVNENVDYNESVLKKFLETAAEWEEEIAGEIFKIIRG